MALTLSLAELALRLSPREHSRQGLRALHELRPERPWIYGLRPGAQTAFALPGSPREILYRVNADGFRDRLYARPRPAGVSRILVLGDSVAFGYGVDEADTFPKQMERALGSGVEVLNLGINGYNPYTEAALFADVGVSYQPDLVLVQFCTNDLNDPTLHFDAQTRLHFSALPDAAFPDPSVRHPPSPWLNAALPLCRRFRLCSLLDQAVLTGRQTPDSRSQLQALVQHETLSAPVAAWLGERYADIAARAGRIGAGFAVLAFPDEQQMATGEDGGLSQQLVSLGDERGWLTIDLLPAFLAAAEQSQEPLLFDLWHPIPTGHRVAAEAILAGLRRAALLPTDGVGSKSTAPAAASPKPAVGHASDW